MEFTEITEISSFSHPEIHSKNINDIHHLASLSHENISTSIFEQPLFSQMIKNLIELNSKIADQQTSPTNTKQNQDSIAQKDIPQTNQSDYREIQISQSLAKYDRTKSIIFKSSFCSRQSLADYKPDNTVIKVFYFGTPIMKLIPYNKNSTIKQLIRRSLETYLLQNNDAIRATQPVQRFEMRLPADEDNFVPDFNIEPIHLDRVLSENMFETLILVEKQKKETSFENKPTKEYSFDQSYNSLTSSLKSENGSGETVKLMLLDETFYELMRIQLDKSSNLEKLFKMVEENNLNDSKEFVIKDDLQSEYDLSPDHEVKLIEKNRLYLMRKKYLDEPEDQHPGPIRLKSLIKEDVNYLPPIGMVEASRYQEFEVTKINSFGIAIERILGIDQTKIYNYQKQLRKQKKQATFVDKFLGFNNQTGTKRPFRMIKDILEIRKFQGGIEVIYPQKISTFIIKDDQTLQKIYRKLSFLFELNRSQAQKASRNLFETKNAKTIGSFLKF